MNRKSFKCYISLFIFIVCAIIFVNISGKIKTTYSFKGFGGAMEVSLVNQNDSYNELKKSIDDKYTKMFVGVLNATTQSFKAKLSEVLGDKYVLLTNEYEVVSSSIHAQIKEFNKSEEYVLQKQKLAELKAKIDACDEAEKQEYLEEFRKTLSNVSLLNTKLNNSLKQSRDRLDEIKREVIKLFIDNKVKLLTIRSEEMAKTHEKLKELFSNYRAEIKELNSTFNIEKEGNNFPFDVATLNDCLIAGKLETECFNEILSDTYNNASIYSENTGNFKS